MKRVAKRGVTRVDFTGVESGGSRVVPDGEYTAKITEIEEKQSSTDNPMLVFKFKITGPKAKGSLLWDNISLLDQALFKLRAILECLKIEAPDSEMDVVHSDLIGEEIGVSIINEIYEGKKRPKVAEYIPADSVSETTEGAEHAEREESKKDEEEDDDEDEKDSKPSKKTGKAARKSSGKPGLKIGQKVSFDDEDSGKTLTGKIVAIDDDEATVSAKGEEWTIGLSELTPA